jgi:hypothetical protein
VRKATRNGRIRRTLTVTACLLAFGVVAAPQALADPGDIGDASLWRTSPKCSQPKDIVLRAWGFGVMEFEYRVVGGETTVHKSRPPVQEWAIHQVETGIPESQIRWRVVARDIDLSRFLGHADIREVEAFCGNDAVAERNENF